MLQLAIQLLLLLFWTPLFAAPSLPPKLSLRTESPSYIAGEPFNLLLSVIHSADQKIVETDLQIDFSILSIVKINEEIINPDNLFADKLQEAPRKAKFRIAIPKQQAGVLSIGPVRFQTKECTFESNRVTIEILSPTISPLFELTGKLLHGESGIIYPGDVVTFEYQLTFSTPLKIIKEDLPLLNPKGFLTVGAPEIEEVENQNLSHPSIQIIRQKARASMPGTYETGVSIIEALSSSTGKQAMTALYRAIAPSLSISITPFPEEGKPTSFYGAIGSFSWRSRTLTHGSLRVGSAFEIEYRASGRGDLSTIRFPDKQLFPSIESNFIIENWPIEGKLEGNTKTFVVQLKPRRSGTLYIPALIISSFDPISKKYLTTQALPITLSIKGTSGEKETEKMSIETIEGAIHGIGPIPILPETVKKTYWDGKITSELLLLFLLVAISESILASSLKKKKRSQQPPVSSSDSLFEEAIREKIVSKKALLLLKKALLMQLFETGQTSKLVENGDEIDGKEPLIQEAKALIIKIDQALYFNSIMTQEEMTAFREEVLLFRYSLKKIAQLKEQKR
ncbi:MAG: BatD family protein [Chlamydia sp.]